MALRIEFRYRDDDPWPIVKNAFDIIEPFLQPGSRISVADTAARVDTLSPPRNPLAMGEESYTCAGFLLELFEIVVDIARQLPYNDPSQQRLVQLLEELAALDTPHLEVSAPMSHTARPGCDS